GLPSRSTATAWWLCLPTSMPIKTVMSAWLVIMSLIFFDSCDRIFWLWFGWPVMLGGSWVRHPRYGRAQGMTSASGSGPYQRFPWRLRTPVTTPPPQIIGDWGHEPCRGPQASDPFLS